MKKFLWFIYLSLCFLPSVVYAAPNYRLTPADSNTQTCVQITTYSWIATPTTALAGRQDLYFSNASTDTYVGTTDNTVAISTGVTPIVVGPKSILHYPLTDGVATYFRSLGNSIGNICSDEQTFK